MEAIAQQASVEEYAHQHVLGAGLAILCKAIPLTTKKKTFCGQTDFSRSYGFSRF